MNVRYAGANFRAGVGHQTPESNAAAVLEHRLRREVATIRL
jgi:hypothetical protein